MSNNSTDSFLISSSLSSAWQLFKEKWLTVYGLMILPLGFGFLYSMIMGMMSESEGGLLSLVLMFLYLMIQLVVGMGVIKGLISLSRGEEVTMETFSGMAPKVFNYLGGMILMSLIIFFGFIALIIPGLYFSLKYYFVPFLIVDKGLGPMEALKESARMTKGVKWDLVGFMMAVMIFGYLGILALFVGLFVTLPVAYISFAFLYNRMLARVQE